MITVFAMFVDSERFPVSAYFQIGAIYFLSFCSIGLLAIDLAFTLEDRYYGDLDSIKTHKTFLTLMWNIIYWGSLLFGSILSQFFS